MGLIVVTTGSALAGTIWDVNADFSNTNGNPNGDWSYGWVNNSAFQLYQTAYQGGSNGISPGWCGPLSGAGPGFPLIWKNTGSFANDVETGQLSLHPGPGGEMSVAQWTAPADWSGGDAAIQGQFFPGDIGTMQVGIFKNGNWSSPRWSASDSGEFTLSVPVVAGDTIDFGVYGGYSYGNTPLEATITAAPEPSTLVLLGIPLASIGFNGKAPAIQTEENKRKRNQLLATKHFARSSVNFSI
jgi:hypothetical protein